MDDATTDRRWVVLTLRDHRLVLWVARYGAVSTDDVLTRFELGRTAGYRRIARLVDAGLVERVRLLYGQPGLLVITRAGLRFVLREELGPCRVSVALFSHWQAVARVAAELEVRGGFQVWSERELRAHERQADKLIASARINRGGEERVHRPDLVLRPPGDELPIAVEVELSIKSARRLEAICRGWARCRHISRVRYLAAPAPARAVRRAIEATQTQEFIDVTALPWEFESGEIW